MTRFLKRHEDLDEMVARLSAEKGRPCFVSACDRLQGGHWILPGQNSPVHIDAFAIYLSTWVGQYPIAPPRLVEAKRVHVIYPISCDEKDAERSIYIKRTDFALVGLHGDINRNREVCFLAEKDVVPESLLPYVGKYLKQDGYRESSYRGIRFAVSEKIERPRFLRAVWHLGYEGEVTEDERRYGLRRAALIQSPGHYSGESITSVEDENHLMVVDSDPGRCVVCRGLSGERGHLAVVDHGRPRCHVCSACAPEMLSAWQSLLEGWTKSTGGRHDDKSVES